MPECRWCGKRWPDGYSMCPADGQPLTAIAAGSTIASSPGGSMVELKRHASEDLLPGSFAGDYQIERKIGQGGMGSVYGARHPLIGKRAAIKVISRELSVSSEGVERFIREAQAVNQIGDENIVDVFGFGKLPDGRNFFVMEWLQGESLRKRLERPLAYAEALAILETIAKALHAAHEAGVVHRDLKPDNVFLEAVKGEPPHVKLLDFGLAKLSSGGDGSIGATQTGVVMGTPLYLSPEQAKGQKVEFPTDVYALGTIAFEMLTGRVPFRADSAVQLMALHISEPPPPFAEVAPHVPLEVDRLVTSMLMKHPRARPSAAVVREKLAAARAMPGAKLIGPPPSTVPTSSPWVPPVTPPMTPPVTPVTAMVAPALATQIDAAPPQQPRRTRWGVALVAGTTVTAGIVIAVVMMTRRADPPVPAQVAVAEEPAPATVDAAAVVPVTVEPAAVEPVKTEPTPVTDVTPTVAKSGKLSVTIVGPAQSQLAIDGKPAGKYSGGARLIDLPAGDHVIEVQARGYKPASATIHVDAGATRAVKLIPEARPTINDAPNPFDESP